MVLLIGKKIASNIFYYFLDFATLTGFGYAFWILMGKMLPPEQYGVLFSVVSLFYILVVVSTLGMYESLPKFISENKKKSEALIRFSMKISIIFSIIVSALIYIFSRNISNVFYGSDKMMQPLQFLSMLLFFGTAFYITKAILQGLQDFKHMFYGELISNIVRIASAVFFVYAGLNALGGALSWIAWFIVASVVFLFFIPKKTSSDKFESKRFMHYSLLSMASLISFYIIFQSGIILLGAMSSMTSAALMGVAFIFGQFVMAVPAIVMGSIYPSLAEFWPKQKDKFTNLFSKAIKIVIAVTLPIMLIFTIFASDLISTLYTSEYVQAAAIFPTFLLGSFLAGLNTILFIALYTANRPQARLITMLIGTIITVALTVMLIPYMGMLGASAAFLTAQIIMMMISLILLNETIKMEFFKRTLLIIPITAVFSFMLLISGLFESAVMKIIGVAMSLLFYLGAMLVFNVVNKEDLSTIRHFPKLSFLNRRKA